MNVKYIKIYYLIVFLSKSNKGLHRNFKLGQVISGSSPNGIGIVDLGDLLDVV